MANSEIPKSRITITYRTQIDGQPADVELPFRLLVLGDFSNGSSSDREDRQAPVMVTVEVEDPNSTTTPKAKIKKTTQKSLPSGHPLFAPLDLASRRIRSFKTSDGLTTTIDALMTDMDIKLDLVDQDAPPNFITGTPYDTDGSVKDTLPVKQLPLRSLNDFAPDKITAKPPRKLSNGDAAAADATVTYGLLETVPELKGLLLLRTLLLEAQSAIDNNKDVRDAVQALYKSADDLKALSDKLDTDWKNTDATKVASLTAPTPQRLLGTGN